MLLPSLLTWSTRVFTGLGSSSSRRLRCRATSALLLDFRTGEVLHAQDADAPVAPASITKLMTMRLVLRELRSGRIAWDDAVPIGAGASVENPEFSDASRMGLWKGERVRVEDLMLGVAVPSACDAAMALAEFLGGSAGAFVAAMNAEAERLGMRHTHFVDPYGLSPQNQTTARDLVKLARRYVEDEPGSLARLHSLPSFCYRSQTLRATNLLIGRYPGVDGLKTGYLDAAGYHQITTAERGGDRLISIVLGTRSKAARRDESAALLEYGFHLLGRGHHLGLEKGEAAGFARVADGR